MPTAARKRLKAHPAQMSTIYDLESLATLTLQVYERGLDQWQPIVATPNGDGFYMVSGHRPRCWYVQTEEQSYHIPMPPFVFVGSGSSYHLFAVKKRPSGEQTPLYHAPCPNVHTTGGICQGNTPFPICSPKTIQQALQLFIEGSLFNADLSRGKCQSHPDDVCSLWAELDGRKRFPLSELVPAQMRLQTLL
jgi:PRTRC genetic system protein B